MYDLLVVCVNMSVVGLINEWCIVCDGHTYV